LSANGVFPCALHTKIRNVTNLNISSRSKITLIILFVLIAAFFLVIYPELSRKAPQYLFWKIDLPASEAFCSAYVLDPQNIWIAGAEGSVYRSSDMGETWIHIRKPDGLIIKSIWFINSETGWIVGESGSVIKTDDGGKTWNIQDIAQDAYAFFSVCFFDKLNGIICGNRRAGEQSSGVKSVMFRTDDGGRHWKEQRSDLPAASGVFFIDMDTGFARVSSGLFKTTDGGESWYEIDNIAGRMFGKLFFIDETYGWAAHEKSGIYATVDGGKSWALSEFTENTRVSDVYFINRNNGWAVGDDGLFLYTRDGGKNWDRLETGVVDDLYRVKFMNKNVGLICGDNGIIIKVENQS